MVKSDLMKKAEERKKKEIAEKRKGKEHQRKQKLMFAKEKELREKIASNKKRTAVLEEESNDRKVKEIIDESRIFRYLDDGIEELREFITDNEGKFIQASRVDNMLKCHQFLRAKKL